MKKKIFGRQLMPKPKCIRRIWILAMAVALAMALGPQGLGLNHVYAAEGDYTAESWDTAANADPRGMTTDGTNIWVTDGTINEVYKYDMSGAYQSKWALTAANDNPRGMTTDGTNIWVVDRTDDEVYKYDMTGTFQSSWDTAASGNGSPFGMTTDGTNIWVTDDLDNKVYKYDMTGTFDSNWDLYSLNSNSYGMTTDGTNIWVTENLNTNVYKYDMSGNLQSSWDTKASGNTDPWGMTTDGTNIWVVENDSSFNDNEVYKYDMTGTFDSFWDTASNENPGGMTTDGTNIWVTDSSNDEVYKYDMSGNLQSSWDTNASGNTVPYGMTTDGTNIWVVDYTDDEVYKYDMSGTYQSKWALTAANTAPYGMTTDGTNIWVVDAGDDEVYKYDMTGTYQSSWDTNASGNSSTRGMTTDGTNIWIVDYTDDEVYRYDMSGTYQLSWDIAASGNADSFGIAINGYLWITDTQDDEVYKYEAPLINAVPTVTSVTDSPDPVVAGNNITFLVDWNDADAEGIKMYICKADDGGTGGCGAGGTWCSNSNDFDSTDPITCAYTTQAGDVNGVKNYYVHVCDDEPSCSSSFSGTFTVESPPPPSPCEDHNVWGWAWSENIGWMSFSCRNTMAEGAGVDYGVDIDPATGLFSGYAWAGGGKDFDDSPVPTIGWISFNSIDLVGCPSSPCEARLDLSTYEISGWARALAYGDGWDGWIKLRGTWTDGVSLNSTPDPSEFEGWAWGDVVVGWISFSCKDGGYSETIEESFSLIAGESSDGYIYGEDTDYEIARSDSTYFNDGGTYMYVGIDYESGDSGGCGGTPSYSCDDYDSFAFACGLVGCDWVGCDGVADSCSSYNPSGETGCGNQSGCTWSTTSGYCDGTPIFVCSNFAESVCTTVYDGCTWDGSECTGTPTSCNTAYLNENQSRCEFFCSDGWYGCSGTADSCDSFDFINESACTDQSGCSWPGCEGTPPSCDGNSNQSECEYFPGCSWDEGVDEEFRVYRDYLVFDTSGIPDDAIITDVKLSLKTTGFNGSDTDFDVEIWKYNWADPMTSGNRETNYDASGAVYDADWRNTSGISTNTYYDSPSLDNSWVNLTGDTKYQLRNSSDVNGDEPFEDEYIGLYPANSAGNEPILKITYTRVISSEHYDICGVSDYKVMAGLNQSPDKPTTTTESWGTCGGLPQIAFRTSVRLNWSYSDPEGDAQEAYEVWVDNDSDFSDTISPGKFNHRVDPSPSESYVLDLDADDEGDWLSEFPWASTYWWKVRVKDINDNWSGFSDTDSFTIPNRASPNAGFTVDPINPGQGEVVTFEDISECYSSGEGSGYPCKDGTTPPISYSWYFGDGETTSQPIDEPMGDTTHAYSALGKYVVRLEVTDSGVGLGPGVCSQEVNVGIPLPEWKEITPF